MFPETKELPVALNKSCYFPRKANLLRLPIRLPTTNQPLFMPRNLSAVDSRQQQPVHSGALGPAPAASWEMLPAVSFQISDSRVAKK